MRPAVLISTLSLSVKRLALLLIALLVATAGSMVLSAPAAVAAPATGANFIATGHDMDYHCNYNEGDECAYFKILVDLVRKSSPLPVLAVTDGPMLPSALTNAGVTPVQVVNPGDTAAFNAVPFTNASGAPLYSAIIVGSGYYSVSEAEIPTVNARKPDFTSFFNGGGGILALSSVGFPGFYDFVPISVTDVSVNGPFAPTALGASYGITSSMANCCATHNSFDTPTDPVVTLETDSTGASETIAAFDAKITGGGFTTAPTVTIDGGDTAYTNDTTPTISGSTNAPTGTAVTVTVGGQTLSGTVGDVGAWSVTAATLTDDTFPVVVTITVDGKTGTGNQSLTVDTAAPVVAVTSAALTNDPTPTISGTADAPAGAAVSVTVAGQTLTTTVQAGGSWSVTPTSLADARYDISVTVTDFAGNAGSATAAVTVDTEGPSLTIDPGPGLLTNNSTAVISGSSVDATVGSTVTIGIAGQSLTAIVGAGGAWSVTPAPIDDGEYTVTVSISDEAGNTTTDTQTRTVDTEAPTVLIAAGAALLTDNATPTITGSTDALVGTAVSVVVDGQTLPAVVADDHTWSVTPATLSPDGTYTLTVSITDAAGNTGSASVDITVDTTAPSITINGGRTAATNDVTPTISGTVGDDVAVGTTVVVHVYGQMLMATVEADHTWSVTAETLPEASPEIVAAVSDPAGNEGTAAQVLTVDVSAPSLSVDGPGEYLTNDNTVTISGTTDADAGSIVTVTVGVTSYPAIVGALGAWSLTLPALADGRYSAAVSVTDGAGNTSTASVLFDIDASAPTGAIDGGDSVLTANGSPTISGVTDAPVGSAVAVVVGDQTLTAAVTAEGTWSVTVPTPLTDDTYVVTVTFADLAGNTTVVSQALTVDTTAPTGTVDGGTDGLAASATPTITGTTDAPAGSTVTVTVNGQTLTGVVSETGAWSVTVATALHDGTYDVVVSFADAAGNPGTVSQSLTVDTTSPTGAVTGGSELLVATLTQTLSGTTDAPDGSVVTVVIGGQTLTARALAGKWQVTVPSPLTDGVYDVSVSFVDAAGNVGTAEQQLTIDTTAPVATFTAGSNYTTTNHSPVISGVTDAPAGSTVVVTVNGQTYTTTVDVLGEWKVSIPELAEGDYTVTVAITDLAGNTTTATETLSIVAEPAPATSPASTPEYVSYGDSGLAYTGFDTSTPFWIALALLALGGGLTVVASRRRRAPEAGEHTD